MEQLTRLLICYKTLVMTLFYLKKNFFDGWDNLFTILAQNVIMYVIVIGGYFLVGTVIDYPAAAIPLLIILGMLLSVLMFAVSACSAKMVNYKSIPVKEVFQQIPSVWKDAVLFALIVMGMLFITSMAVPFYLRMGNLLGIALAAVIFWIAFVSILAFQWFLPLYSQLGGGFKKTFKKSYILFFDNTFFTVFMGIYSLFLFIFSVVLIFLAPGIAGIILAHNNALKLRMYKYDWLEQHPELSLKEARKHIPWDELVAEDNETLGPRTLRSFIFPWK